MNGFPKIECEMTAVAMREEQIPQYDLYGRTSLGVTPPPK
jgi:hypothetical protein